MLKNSWPCICLMLILSPPSFAVSQTEQDDAYYRADRPGNFNRQEERLNDQGYIEDALQPQVKGLPNDQPIKAKAGNCVRQGSDEECEDIEITN